MVKVAVSIKQICLSPKKGFTSHLKQTSNVLRPIKHNGQRKQHSPTVVQYVCERLCVEQHFL